MGITQQTNMQIQREKVNALIQQGQKRGLTGKDVIDALVRKGYEPEGIDVQAIKQKIQPVEETKEEEPTTFERIKTGIEEKGVKVEEAISGTGEYQDKDVLERSVGATAQAFSAISGTLYNALPEVGRKTLDKLGETIGGGINYIADKISNNPALQEAVSNPEFTKNLESGLKIVSDLGLISGEIAGTKALVKPGEAIETGISNTVKELATDTEKLSTYPTSIADAISEKITRIDPKVKNVLDTTSIEKFDNYVKAGEEAIKNPRALTPLEKAGDIVKTRILPTIKEDLSKIGSQKSKSLSSIGNTQIPNATQDVISYIKESTKGLKLTPEENKLIKQAISDLEIGKSPTISTIDKTVDLLQNTLFEKSTGVAIPTTSRVKSIINQSIGKLNATVKKVAKETLKSDEYSVLNDAYATRVKLFQNLNKLLGEEGKRGGSLIKRFFSPQDSGTKKLFAQINDIYGIDLAEDATIAKFVMESLGDSRASSLLQMVPLSKGGAVTKAINLAEQKLTKPIQKARKIVESSSRNLKKNKK